MISDSPYRMSHLILSPLAGGGTGFLAALGMLILLAVMQPLSDQSVKEVLIKIGAIVPSSEQSQARLIQIGLGIHLFVGSLLGLLYAACQQRVPLRGLVAVGLFYGLFIWIVSSVLIRLFFSPELHQMVHHWLWFLAHLVYGLCLAGAAILKQARQPLPEVMPKD